MTVIDRGWFEKDPEGYLKHLINDRDHAYHTFLKVLEYHGGNVFVPDDLHDWRERETKVQAERDENRGGTVWSLKKPVEVTDG